MKHPGLHVVELSHTLPAAHTVPAATAGCVQPPEASQASVVHALPSSVHVAPTGLYPLVEQAAELPVQYSATSHTLATARHSVVAGL